MNLIGFTATTPDPALWTLWGLAAGQWARHYLPLIEHWIGGHWWHGRHRQADDTA